MRAERHYAAARGDHAQDIRDMPPPTTGEEEEEEGEEEEEVFREVAGDDTGDRYVAELAGEFEALKGVFDPRLRFSELVRQAVEESNAEAKRVAGGGSGDD